MSHIVVIYQSKYGSTKKYAQWIAEELNGDLFHCSKIKKVALQQYKTIIFCGGLYASKMKGITTFTKLFPHIKNKRLIVFTVGFASTNRKEVFTPIIEKNFTVAMREVITFFHFRGAIDYKKLTVVHKAMMAMLKKMLLKKDPSKLSKDDRVLLSTYGKKIDFIDQNSIKPLINYVKGY